MCVPLCVESVMFSTAQPSLSGKSEGFSPGKYDAIESTVSRCLRYVICGCMPGGSEMTSASMAMERSTNLLGIVAPCVLRRHARVGGHLVLDKSLRGVLTGFPPSRE